jgi:PAS domain S-box-containing protein
MPEGAGPEPDVNKLRSEIVRLNKIVKALMDRSERSARGQGSEYGLFQTAVTLQQEVRARTADLEAALRENERIGRDLRESEGRFRGLVNQSLVGIVLIEDDRFTYSNAKFDEMFGYTAAEVLQLGPKDMAVESDRPLVDEQLGKRLDGSARSVEYVFQGLKKNGEVLHVECHSSALALGGRAPLVSVVLDITERRRADEAVRASLRDKEALLKETHHRVKNNLALIASLMRLEAGRSRVAETKTALEEMQARISSVALLNQTLYQSGSYTTVQLADYLKQVATQVFRAQGPDSAAVRLALDLAPVEVQTAQAIPCGLIVNELITNSLKHGFADGSAGDVSVSLRRGTDGSVNIRVVDSGVGLPQDFATRRITSLGLQLVGDLSKQLRGSLDIGPAGPGSAFTITFVPTADEP